MSLRIADFFIGALSGALMAFCSHIAISPSLNMLLGMILGGLIGMSLMMIWMVLLMPFFGAFEVMIPLHINAMFVGMPAGMLSTLSSLTLFDTTLAGGGIGFFITLQVYLSNKHLTQTNNQQNYEIKKTIL